MIKETRKTTTMETPGAFSNTTTSGNDGHSRFKRDHLTILLGPGLACLLLLIVVAASAGVARAQLSIPVVRGDTGLKSGSQPGPGVYVTGLVYYYGSNEIIDKDGRRFNRVSIDQYLPAAALTYVSKRNSSAGIIRPRSSYPF